MTLVYGCATSDIGFLVADTLLSFEIEQSANYTGPVNGAFHALKIHIVGDGNTAIAFAGDVELACDLVSALKAAPDSQICDRLFESLNAASSIGRRSTEFLVLQKGADGTFRLTHITGEQMTHPERWHIGEPQAYTRMMQLCRSYEPPRTRHVQQSDGTFRTEPLTVSAGEIEFEEISRAMEALASERKSSSVGAIAGCVTRVVDARISGKLEYLQAHEAGVTPWEGESGFSFLASNSAVRGCAVYYRAGKMGYVLVAGDPERCRKEYANSLTDFIRAANAKYGLNLE